MFCMTSLSKQIAKVRFGLRDSFHCPANEQTFGTMNSIVFVGHHSGRYEQYGMRHRVIR
jgi:hypothetical protein